jgi:SAM-dependent methyltransferase
MFTESGEFYDAIYSFKNYEAESAQIAALVRSVRSGAQAILDVGCGTGEHARILATQHGFDVDGLDIDPTLLARARAKHPAGYFFQADMSDFSLPRRYDIVLCLFSSIGYLVTLERTSRALMCFRKHLEPEGVLFIEPWFPPGVLEEGRVFCQTGVHNGMTIERISRTEVAGRVSRLHFKYQIETPAGTQHATEIHQLGLFTADEMRVILHDAGFSAEFDEVGLTGRGLWTARLVA